MTNEISDTDYRWLTGPDAREWLDELAHNDDPLHVQVQRLRRDLSAERTHLVVEQTQLRERAKAKFAAARQMFFTPLGLEQSTDQWVAAYKAKRFGAGKSVADLCCGIGGDLMGLATRGPATGVDRSPVHAVLAEANCRALNCEVRTCDVEQIDLASFDAWHIDPDRRAKGRRTTKVVLHEPDPSVIEKLLKTNAQAAIKLAPAAELPDDWYDRAYLEWISRSGQCRQLVVWFGDLAQGHDIQTCGTRSATVLSSGEQAPQTIVGSGKVETSTAEGIGRYLYEPDPAVLVAGLTGALADEHQLWAIAPGHAYLTSDQLRSDPMLASFEVTDVLPFQPKRLKQIFRERGVGRLEVKKRGVSQDPAVLQKQLRSTGEAAATLLLARVNGTVTAIIAQRVKESTGDL